MIDVKYLFFLAPELEVIVQKSFRLRCQAKIIQVRHSDHQILLSSEYSRYVFFSIFLDLSVTGQELSLVSSACHISGPALCLFLLSLTLTSQ